MSKRWAKATRLENTRIWVQTRVMGQRDEQRDRCLAGLDGEKLTIQRDHWEGVTEGYEKALEMVLSETEETFSFASFAVKVGRAYIALENAPTKWVSDKDQGLHVRMGRHIALREVFNFCDDFVRDGEHMIFDRKPRARAWKQGVFSNCASPINA